MYWYERGAWLHRQTQVQTYIFGSYIGLYYSLAIQNLRSVFCEKQQVNRLELDIQDAKYYEELKQTVELFMLINISERSAIQSGLLDMDDVFT